MTIFRRAADTVSSLGGPVPWILLHWRLIAFAVTAGFLSLGWYLADARADRWQAKAELTAAQFKTFRAEVVAQAAKITAAALRRIVDDANTRNNITVELSNGYQNDLAVTRARYDRLRAQYAKIRGGTGQAATVSGVPDAACRYHEDAAHPGFFTIPAGCAADLMQQADENTLQLVKAQAWIDAQRGVPVE